MNGNVNERLSTSGSGHSLRAVERKHITVQGVTDVISFDEESVCMATVDGYMALEGEGLRVSTLNTKDGVVEVMGKLNGLLYEDVEPTNRDKEPRRRGRLFS